MFNDTLTSRKKFFQTIHPKWRGSLLTAETLHDSADERMDSNPYHLTQMFHAAFNAPVAADLVLSPSVSDRQRRLKLILEEFLELCEGMGFELEIDGVRFSQGFERLDVAHIEGSRYCPVETADALGDLNVVVNGTAVEFGIPMPAVNIEIFLSNMTKLGDDGQPIVNGVTANYREGEVYYRSDVPIGKILKGPNYVSPNIPLLLYKHIKGE